MSTIGQKCPVSGKLANELVAAAAVEAKDKVIVAGAGQLELLVALLRRGVADADCLSANCGPHPPSGEASVVIAPSVENETDLINILHRFGASLRPCGTLVLREASPTDFCSERRLRQVFVEAGFASIERIPRRSGEGPVWLAHKQPAAMANAA